MEVKKIKLRDISPADYNPRFISNTDFVKLEKSIDTFGLVDPIIVNNNDNTIIGGHQRYDVLVSKYGLDFEMNMINLGGISWVFVDDIDELSDDYEKALNISLNKISGEWDTIKLFDILNDLKKSYFDVEITGFDLEDIDMFNIEKDIVYHNEETLKELDEKGKERRKENNELMDNMEYNSIMVFFDSEEDMANNFDYFVNEGYNCRMSKS